ncbi:alpha/beta fold hydrolase [Duffyella gerundensis]|uniref:alpha/beta fold hydrolase n=1 Tax=Duffyella gerundensis TaxID=1619313 RepID=UPI0021F6CC7B|nr:alpha/beta hydrolase [Duffyella gerundensis]
MKEKTQRNGKQRALMVAMAAGMAGTVWGIKKWRALQQTPPVGIHSHHAGLAGYYQQIGRWRIFTRATAKPMAGLPVVLIHGLVLSGRAMEDLAIALSWDFRVLVPDLPGYGASAMPASSPTLTVDQQADALWQWMQHNDIPRALFIGNSFGCQVLAALAVRHPEAVAALVLQGPTVDRHARFLPVQMWRDWRNGRREKFHSPASLSRVDYAKAGVFRALASIRIMMRDRIEQRLPYIQAPTLLVRGSRDVVSPARWIEEMDALLPDSEILTLQQGTHTLNYVYPWNFCRAIRPFLMANREHDHE